jgi:hypothetical protein
MKVVLGRYKFEMIDESELPENEIVLQKEKPDNSIKRCEYCQRVMGRACRLSHLRNVKKFGNCGLKK